MPTLLNDKGKAPLVQAPAAPAPTTSETSTTTAIPLVPFLPGDDAADEGPSSAATAATTSALRSALSLGDADFWLWASADRDRIGRFLDSFLQFAERPYDYEGGGREGKAPSLSSELRATVLLLLLRLAEGDFPPSASSSSSSPLETASALLTLPRLLDACSLYLFDPRSSRLARRLVRRAWRRCHASLPDELEKAVPSIAESLEGVKEALEEGARRKRKGAEASGDDGGEVVDGLSFLRDSAFSLAALAAAHRGCAAEMLEASGGVLVAALAAAHDEMLPAVEGAFCRSEGAPTATEKAIVASASELRVALQDCLGAVVRSSISPSPLSPTSPDDGSDGDDVGEAIGDSPAAVGEALVAALSSAAAATAAAPVPSSARAPPRLLPSFAARCDVLAAIERAEEKGRVSLDDVQKEYISALLSPTTAAATTAAAQPSRPLPSREQLASLVSSVSDILPGYGDGFLAAALSGVGFDPEALVAALLEGTTPEAAAGVDRSAGMEDPRVVAALRPPVAPPVPAPGASPLPPRKPARPLPRSSAAILGSARESDRAATAAAAALLRYSSDEEDGERGGASAYDDDFDSGESDDGGRVGGGVRGEAEVEGPSASTWPRSQKQKMTWVKNGRLFNYAAPGASLVVGGARAAAAAVRATREEILGLGAGGNRAVAAAAGSRGDGGEGPSSSPSQPPPPSGGRGRGGRGRGGGGRGRGGGGGRGGHHQRERAARKASSGLG